MSTVEPCPYHCKVCKKPAILYADSVLWCEDCGRKLSFDEVIDKKRGVQRNTPSPQWKRLNK